MVELIAARLLEGSLIPYLGPALQRAPPFPASPAELAAWLAQHAPGPETGVQPGDLGLTAALVERRLGRRALVKLLREAYAPVATTDPLHLLLAGLPSLPLAVSAFFDATLLELLRAVAPGGRTLALVHGVSPADGRGVFFAEAEGEGLSAAGQADTLVYQPLGTPVPAASFLVTEADAADALVALPTQAPIPPEVQRRRDGCGLLLVGCRFEWTVERLFVRGILEGAAGPHFAVLPGPPGPGVEAFLAAEGITALALTQERFVAELSRALAQPGARPGAGARDAVG
jgi:hypothetical protein